MANIDKIPNPEHTALAVAAIRLRKVREEADFIDRQFERK
jgi:hypothetical protein